MKDSENCGYCNEKETILHMFANCPETVKIQKQILRVLRTNCITVNEFIFGNNNKAETLIFLVVKWMLWSSRFHGSDLNIHKIISEVKLRISIDRNKLSNFIYHAKWNKYTHILEA